MEPHEMLTADVMARITQGGSRLPRFDDQGIKEWMLTQEQMKGIDSVRYPSDDPGKIINRHRTVVAEAVAAGHEVPAAVLADYEDLTPGETSPSSNDDDEWVDVDLDATKESTVPKKKTTKKKVAKKKAAKKKVAKVSKPPTPVAVTRVPAGVTPPNDEQMKQDCHQAARQAAVHCEEFHGLVSSFDGKALEFSWMMGDIAAPVVSTYGDGTLATFAEELAAITPTAPKLKSLYRARQIRAFLTTKKKLKEYVKHGVGVKSITPLLKDKLDPKIIAKVEGAVFAGKIPPSKIGEAVNDLLAGRDLKQLGQASTGGNTEANKVLRGFVKLGSQATSIKRALDTVDQLVDKFDALETVELESCRPAVEDAIKNLTDMQAEATETLRKLAGLIR